MTADGEKLAQKQLIQVEITIIFILSFISAANYQLRQLILLITFTGF